MAYYLLERDRVGASQLAEALNDAVEKVSHCRSCMILTEQDYCQICSDERRDNSSICVVETPADVYAIEQSGSFRGKYFVLMGHLSPLDGIGPDDLNLPSLFERAQKESLSELILATNTTVEGEATAYYIIEQLKQYQIKITRIAHGVPLGGELEYIDGSTLGHAFAGRKEV